MYIVVECDSNWMPVRQLRSYDNINSAKSYKYYYMFRNKVNVGIHYIEINLV